MVREEQFVSTRWIYVKAHELRYRGRRLCLRGCRSECPFVPLSSRRDVMLI
jgi:hypothetical protein